MKSLYLILIIPLCIFFSSCKKNTSYEQLPPVTQNGANTFGCLINGNVWIPKGFDGRHQNSLITVDPANSDGGITIHTYRIDGDYKYDLTIFSDSIKNVGVYTLGTNSRCVLSFGKSLKDNGTAMCLVDNSRGFGNPSKVNGFLKITRYDLQNGIFSGEFEASFGNIDCGLGTTVNIAQGRFDYR